MFCVLLRQLWTWVMQGAAQPGMEICFDVLDGVVSCSFLRQLTLPKAPEAAGAAVRDRIRASRDAERRPGAGGCRSIGRTARRPRPRSRARPGCSATTGVLDRRGGLHTSVRFQVAGRPFWAQRSLSAARRNAGSR